MSFARYFKYPYADYHRACVGIFATMTAIVICMIWHFNIMAMMWLVIISALSCLALCGKTKGQQIKNLLFMAVVLIASMLITTIMLNDLPLFLFWLIMIALLWGILLLPKKRASFTAGSIITVVYLVMVIAKGAHPYHLSTLLLDQSLPVLSGMFIIIAWVVLLPTSPIAIPVVDQSSYFIKRTFRLSIAIPLAFLLGYWMHLQHASWICYTVIVVSQANFGATIRKSIHRLTGTILGVMLGVPLTIYVFSVYPWSHWLILILFFMCLLCAVRFYYLAIFLATLIIASVYYIATPAHVGPVMYIMYRLLDTLSGVVLVLLLEMMIFPNSVELQVRKSHRQFWGDLHRYLQAIADSNIDQLPQLKQQLKQNLTTLMSAMHDMEFEPIGKLTLRFRKADMLFKTYNRLACALLNEHLWQDLGDQKQQVLQRLLKVLKQLEQLPYADHEVLTPIMADIKQQQIKTHMHISSHQAMQELQSVNACLLKTIEQIEDISTTKRWTFR